MPNFLVDIMPKYEYKLFLSLIGLSLCLVFNSCGGNKRTGIETELIIAARADDYINEPLKSRLGMYPLNTQICESLVRITAAYEIEPLLATRWERRGNTWRFFLRPGVVFSNGQPLTSEAVKYTFERLVKGDAPMLPETTVRLTPMSVSGQFS